ncbi:MAG: fumarylpyruvate hydrolase [Pseudohongiellaceae bacterium]|jgi:fumarylpyruvate hydrolase
METVFASAQQVAVPVVGTTAVFPVRRVYCVGQNYSAHVREMGGDPSKTQPVFFSKPSDALVIDNSPVNYPMATASLHFEAELVVALEQGGLKLTAAQAQDCIFGYGVGIDFTRRDLQAKCKAKGQPWDIAKGFDQSAPISAIKPLAQCSHVDRARIWLSVDNVIKQDANTDDMIWDVPSIIAELSTYFELKAGDLIFTGTPSGVDAVSVGDCIRAGIDGVGELEVKILEGV